MSYLIQYTRLTTSDKLPDRFLTSQVYKPASSDQFKSGIIFSQVEILNPWFPTSQIGQTIVNTVIREYYRGEDTSELVNFETALRKVNETLSQIAQNGETDWVGATNGIIILVNGREIHFSQTGRSQAYLFRGGKINHITEGLSSNAEPHPLKTFSNITSGTLQVHDKIIIGNPGLFDQITLDVLRDIVSETSPALAAGELAQYIRHQRIQNINAIILELATKDEVANLPLEHKIDTVYLDQVAGGAFWKGARKFLTDHGGPAWQKTKEVSADLWQKTREGMREKVWPALRAGSKKAGAASAAGFQKITVYSQLSSKTIAAKIKQGTQNLDQKMKTDGRTPLPVAKPAKLMHPIWQKIFRGLKKIGNFAAGIYQKVVQSKLGQKIGSWQLFSGSRLYVSLAAILIIVLAVWIGVSKFKSSKPTLSQEQVTQTLDNMQLDYDQAQLAESIAETAKALDLYQKVTDAAAGIPQEAPFFSQAQELKEKTEAAINRLTQTTTIHAREIAGDAGGGQMIKVIDSDAYLITASDIKKVALIGSAIRQIVAFDSDRDGSIKSADFLEEDNQFLCYSDQNKIIAYDFVSKKPTVILPKDEISWESADKIKVFGGNIYLLSVVNKQIIKHSRLDDGYSAGALFVSGEAIDFGKVADWAIDGAVWLLRTDGKLQKVSRTGEETLEIKGIPAGKTIIRPAHIFADFDTDTIFVLDAQSEHSGQSKLYELNKSGEFVRAYLLSEEAKNLTDIDLNLKERKAWIISGNKVYEFELS